MENSIYIFLSLVFFVYIIISSIVYMVISNKKFMIQNEQIKRLSNSFGKMILEQLGNVEKGKVIDSIEKKKIIKLTKKTIYRRAFDESIIKYNDTNNNPKVIRRYMEQYEKMIKRELKKISKRDDIKLNYYIDMLGEYKLNKDYSNEFLINALNRKSLNIRYSAFTSISKIGEVECFLRAIKTISVNEGYINKKIFLDIIEQFAGDKKELNKGLIQYFDDFIDEIKIVIINYFENIECKEAKDVMIKLLKDNNKHLEVRANIIRYFSKVYFKDAEIELIKLLSDENWELRAVAAKAIGKYYSKSSVQALLISITDVSWYVRLNSAMSLLDFNLGDSLINEVVKKNDKYAIDILYYAMFERNEINYEEYQRKTNSSYKEEPNKGEEVAVC